MLRSEFLFVGIIFAFSTVAFVAADNGPWTLGWFPNKPGDPDTNPVVELPDLHDTKQGPKKPGETDRHEPIPLAEVVPTINDTWKGDWFPNMPGRLDKHTFIEMNENKPGQTEKSTTADELKTHFVGTTTTKTAAVQTASVECDNGMNNIEVDFDPNNKTQLSSYICQEDRQLFRPKYTTSPLLFEQKMPKHYVGGQICIDTPIEYDGVPMYGAHRPVAPQYGEYVYVPPERWLNSMASGAIIMLYHPCADATQIESLKNIITHCLRRHIISASALPSAERPLVLVAWGHRLEMSAVSQPVVVDFIRQHALHGVPKSLMRPKNRKYHLYDRMLVKPADVVSDEADAELCPNLV